MDDFISSADADSPAKRVCKERWYRGMRRTGKGPAQKIPHPVRLLRLGRGVAPVVFGEVRSRANPAKTLLFYNHYDVQPAEPLDLWDDPPFSGVRKGNKVFGRGATDDKGELITRIKAVQSCLETTGDVPCNVKFVIEGEEETGSEHIEEYM